MNVGKRIDLARHHFECSLQRAADHALDRVGIAIGNQIFRRTVEKYPDSAEELMLALPDAIIGFVSDLPDLISVLIDEILNGIVRMRPPEDPEPPLLRGLK